MDCPMPKTHRKQEIPEMSGNKNYATNVKSWLEASIQGETSQSNGEKKPRQLYC